MKIAIIGSGISGLTAAYLLNEQHQVSIFESEPRVGGHTATKRIVVEGIPYRIDTGFIVYNDRTYPNFIKLLSRLGVESQPTDMSFSVSCEHTGLEYNGTSINGLFAQRRNVFSTSFLGMLRDIVRFNREAVADLEEGRIAEDTTLGEYLEIRGYEGMFVDQYLVPMGAAIWSSTRSGMLDFPLLFFVRLFRNHGLLNLRDRPQWRVIKGGSENYLPALTEEFRQRIFTNSRVDFVERQEHQVQISVNGSVQSFDQVVFACHSDQALAILKDPAESEKQVLGAIDYRENEVVLHTDKSLLPAQRRAWASWNYRVKGAADVLPTLTYNMNMLQGLQSEHTFCVTLNDTAAIDPARILGKYRYSHPVFTLDAVRAASRWQEINGVNRSWYCGAYWANGFHEDGCSSGIRVATALGAEWQ